MWRVRCMQPSGAAAAAVATNASNGRAATAASAFIFAYRPALAATRPAALSRSSPAAGRRHFSSNHNANTRKNTMTRPRPTESVVPSADAAAATAATAELPAPLSWRLDVCSAFVQHARYSQANSRPCTLMAQWPRLVDLASPRVSLCDFAMLDALERRWRTEAANAGRTSSVHLQLDALREQRMASPLHYAFLMRAYLQKDFQHQPRALIRTLRLLREVMQHAEADTRKANAAAAASTSGSNSTAPPGSSSPAVDISSQILFPPWLYGQLMSRAVFFCNRLTRPSPKSSKPADTVVAAALSEPSSKSKGNAAEQDEEDADSTPPEEALALARSITAHIDGIDAFIQRLRGGSDGVSASQDLRFNSHPPLRKFKELALPPDTSFLPAMAPAHIAPGSSEAIDAAAWLPHLVSLHILLQDYAGAIQLIRSRTAGLQEEALPPSSILGNTAAQDRDLAFVQQQSQQFDATNSSPSHTSAPATATSVAAAAATTLMPKQPLTVMLMLQLIFATAQTHSLAAIFDLLPQLERLVLASRPSSAASSSPFLSTSAVTSARWEGNVMPTYFAGRSFFDCALAYAYSLAARVSMLRPAAALVQECREDARRQAWAEMQDALKETGSPMGMDDPHTFNQRVQQILATALPPGGLETHRHDEVFELWLTIRSHMNLPQLHQFIAATSVDAHADSSVPSPVNSSLPACPGPVLSVEFGSEASFFLLRMLHSFAHRRDGDSMLELLHAVGLDRCPLSHAQATAHAIFALATQQCERVGPHRGTLLNIQPTTQAHLRHIGWALQTLIEQRTTKQPQQQQQRQRHKRSSLAKSSAASSSSELAILLVLQLEVATHLEQWEEFESVWHLLESSGLLHDSIEAYMKRRSGPLGIAEIRRAFKMLALVSLRTGDAQLMQRHLVDAVSPATIDSLQLILSPAVRHALLWSYYLTEKWQAGVSLRDLSVRIGCSEPSSSCPRVNDCTYAEMMLECLTRCAQRHVDAQSPRVRHEEAFEKLVSFSWTGSAATASASKDKDELHSLYTALDRADAEDAAADLADVSAALRQELCDITRKRLMTITWADRPDMTAGDDGSDDALCPVRVAVHAQTAREASVARALALGLPAPSFSTPPRPLTANRPLLQVTLHHYHSSAALAASIGLLLRCIKVLEPLHGVPDVQLHLAPWQSPTTDAPAVAATPTVATNDSAPRSSPSASTPLLSSTPVETAPTPLSSSPSSWWPSLSLPISGSSSAQADSSSSASATPHAVLLSAQEAVSAWSSHALPTGSVLSTQEHAPFMHELAALWLYALGAESGVDPAALWKPAQPFVHLDAAQLAKVQKRLSPPPTPTAASPLRTRALPELTLKQALQAMQSPFSNLYDEHASRRRAAGELSDSTSTSSRALPAAPSESPSQRHYALMRDKIKLGEAQAQQQAPTATTAPAPPAAGEMA